MNFESVFRPKSKQDLEKQVTSVSENLNTELVHESMQEDLGFLDVKNLKEKYQFRYNTYLAMLRAERKNDDINQNEAKDINKAKIYINALNNLDNYIQEQARGEHKVLRGRQIHVFDAIRDALERGVTRGYIKLPTGVGKTVLFSQVLEALKLKAFIGVPSLPLVKQTSDKLETFTNRTYGVYSGEEKDLTKEITTITYQSLINTIRAGIVDPKNVPIFIADESHKALGPETSKAMDEFGLVLEFTATPGSKNLPEQIYTMTLKEAIQEGLVCRTKTIHAYTDVDLSSVPIDHGDYDQKELEKKINTHGRNMAALELYKNKFSHLKAMVNCTGVQHAKDVAELFQKNGVKTVAVYGDMSEDEKKHIFKKLEKGEIQVITNAKLLIEGFDEPTISLALNLDPTISPTKAEQRGGRALRLDDSNPDKWGYVIDFIDKNTKRKPVLFSEILEGAVVTPEEDVEIEDEVVEEINKTTTSETKDILEDLIESENELEKNNPDEITEIKNKEEKILSKPKKIDKNYDPIDWSDLNIDGLRVVVDVKEIMQVTKENVEEREKLKNIREVQEGWYSPSMLKTKFGCGKETVKKQAEKYRPDHPEWFEIMRTGTLSTECYHPELVDILIKELKLNESLSTPDKRPGWESASELQTVLEMSHHSIKIRAEKYRPDHSDWFEFQKTHGRRAECYHPELVAILKDKRKLEVLFKKEVVISPSKEGWYSANSLMSILNAGEKRIKRIAEKYRPDHSDWFEFQQTYGKPVETYHPELIEMIKKEIQLNNFLKIKEDSDKDKKRSELLKQFKDKESQTNNLEKVWYNANKISQMLDVWIKAVQRAVEKYRPDHPEWFNNEKTSNAREGERYSSEIYELMKIDLGK